MNLKSIFITLVSFIWLFISIKQWAFDYPDISSLLFSIGFFFTGLFVAYTLWYHEINEERINDIQAIDKKLNELEVKFIELKRRNQNE